MARRIGGIAAIGMLAFVAGCAFGGGGLGVLAGILVLAITWGLLSLGGGTACRKGDDGSAAQGAPGSTVGDCLTVSDDAGGWRSGELPEASDDDDPYPRICLSPPPVRPCLDPLPLDVCLSPRLDVCLQPPFPPSRDAGATPPDLHVCLQVPRPCLSPPPADVCLEIEPCLTQPRPTVCLSVRRRPTVCLSVMPCLSEPIGPCLGPPLPQPCLRSPAGDPDGFTGAAPGPESAERLVSAGVLSPDQLQRLERLRGTSGGARRS